MADDRLLLTPEAARLLSVNERKLRTPIVAEKVPSATGAAGQVFEAGCIIRVGWPPGRIDALRAPRAGLVGWLG